MTIAGKGVSKVSKRVKKAKTIAVRIASTGVASALLSKAGSVRLRVRATFKPTSGIAVSKPKSIVLELR